MINLMVNIAASLAIFLLILLTVAFGRIALLAWQASKREPDLVINQSYLRRWYVFPRSYLFNVYLHNFVGDDDSRAPHDHPWPSLSIRLKGEIIEKYLVDGKERLRMAPRICFRKADHAHILFLPPGVDSVWTLFITGSSCRDWGFHCPKGWQHHATMTNKQGEQIGGCE